MNRLWAVGAAIVCLSGWAGPRLLAGDAQVDGRGAGEDARAILVDSDRRHRARSEEYIGEVTVIAKNGRERRKQWRSYRNGPPGASDRLIRFLSPPDVRGVGYLARNRRDKKPEEWLYLPSMKRERRIGARDREGAFVGTSFNYEDLDLLELDDSRYDYALLPAQTVDGTAMHVIELVPRAESVYARKVLTIRKDNLCLLTADFFVSGNVAPVKRLTFANYATVDGYVVATRIEIADFRKGGRTIVALHDVALDRPQPRDRYTIQNLLREDEGAPIGVRPPPHARTSGALHSQPAFDSPAAAWAGGFSGYVEARSFASERGSDSRGGALWQWATARVRQTGRVGPARIAATLRLEESSASRVGPLAFDPADRNPRRSPLSFRELSVQAPIRPGLDVEVGRFDAGWGGTDGFSFADAFLPRDLTDPLSEERLPLWGARVRGEHHGVRVELVVAPVTTPWRLPDLGGYAAPFSSVGVTLVERAWSVPHAGFQAVRVEGTVRGWDVGGWARSGIRPAPVLVPRLDIAEHTDGGLVVPLERHFAHENAGGAQISRDYGGWIVRAELGVSHSNDPSLGDAVIWTIGGSRLVGDGTFTATVAGNAIEPRVNPLLLFDRGLLPVVILAIRELEPWGTWRAAWLGTFHTVGGVLTTEVTRDLTDVVKLTVGADVPHGASLSPAEAFSGGKRLRAGVRWSW